VAGEGSRNAQWVPGVRTHGTIPGVGNVVATGVTIPAVSSITEQADSAWDHQRRASYPATALGPVYFGGSATHGRAKWWFGMGRIF